MPLAIELAASRVRSMSLVQLAARLADRFKLLRSSARGGTVGRHQTLRATVEWSYRLLTPDEQVVFDWSSVFAGSFDLDAAEAVCGFGPIDEPDVFDLLGSLVDKSLVVVDRESGRYRLLETLRQYGVERLDDRGETGTLRGRHLDHFVEVAERAREWFEGTRCGDGRELFGLEWDNLRAGIERALVVGDASSACAVIGTSDYFAMMTCRCEHADWARRVLADLDATAVVWGAAGWWALDDGDAAAAVRFGEGGLRVAPSPLHPTTVRCWRLITSAHLFSFRGREGREAARNWADAAAATSPYDAAAAAAHQGLAVARRDPTAAAALIDTARGVVRSLDNNLSLECWVEFVAGLVEFGAGRYDSSTAIQTRVVAMSEQSGCRMVAGVAAGALAMCTVESGTASAELWIDTLSRLRAINSWGYLWAGIEAVALNWVSADRVAQAAVVLGHLDEHDHRFPTLALRRSDALDALSSEQELRVVVTRENHMAVSTAPDTAHGVLGALLTTK